MSHRAWHAAQNDSGLRYEWLQSRMPGRQARSLTSTLRAEDSHPAVLAASHAARSCASSRASSAVNCASSALLRASSTFRPAASGAPAAAAAGSAARSTLSRYARRSSALVLPSKKPPVMVRSASLDHRGAAAWKNGDPGLLNSGALIEYNTKHGEHLQIYDCSLLRRLGESFKGGAPELPFGGFADARLNAVCRLQAKHQNLQHVPT